jgi:hypothetical protein
MQKFNSKHQGSSNNRGKKAREGIGSTYLMVPVHADVFTAAYVGV